MFGVQPANAQDSVLLILITRSAKLKAHTLFPLLRTKS